MTADLPDFDHFNHDDAWNMGRAMVEQCGVPDFHAVFGLSRADYAPGEGGVPIRVHGTHVGVLAVSGLDDDGGDHDIVLAGLRDAAAAQREETRPH